MPSFGMDADIWTLLFEAAGSKMLGRKMAGAENKQLSIFMNTNLLLFARPASVPVWNRNFLLCRNRNISYCCDTGYESNGVPSSPRDILARFSGRER